MSHQMLVQSKRHDTLLLQLLAHYKLGKASVSTVEHRENNMPKECCLFCRATALFAGRVARHHVEYWQ